MIIQNIIFARKKQQREKKAGGVAEEEWEFPLKETELIAIFIAHEHNVKVTEYGFTTETHPYPELQPN